MLELQDELQRLAPVTTWIILQDEKTLTERGQVYLLPEELSDESHQIVISVQRLRTRVLDPDLRRAAGDFISLYSRDAVAVARMPKDTAPAELRQQEAQLTDAYTALTELLGEHLRCELDRRILAT